MRQIESILLFLLLFAGLNAQNLSFEFSPYQEERITLCLKNGTACDTVFSGLSDEKGKIEIILPDKYASYQGMASLLIGQENGVSFIINGEKQPFIGCDEEKILGGNVIFKNSRENEALQEWFIEQAVRQQKILLINETLRLYNKNDTFFSSLQTEKEKLMSEQSEFESGLKKNPLYAAQYIRMYNFLNSEVISLPYADSTQMATVREYVTDDLDVENLFTSGLWFDTLNGLLVLYDENTPYHEDFIDDMTLLLKKASSERTYITLAENLFSICDAMGWNNREEELAYFLVNDGRIDESPSGKLKMLMTLFKLSKGSKVPVLSNGKELRNTLLIFYESGCNNCENEIYRLKGNYPMIKEKGYNVVSVSADMDEDTFKNIASTFPWEEKYCDLKGVSGIDFKNYGVIGTPTFFLIDNEGRVKGRYARLQDTELLD